MAKKPNILILMADQLAAGALPAYGNRVARTPAIDALAERSVVFDAAYCNAPLCAPSRAVFLSGRLPSMTGAYDNAAEFAADTPTFAHHLRLSGYRTILAGKMHFCGPDQLHGFEERLTTDIYPADFGWTPDWQHPEARPDWYHTMDSVTQAGPCVRTNQTDFDEEVVFNARRKLFDIARGADRRPFCLTVSLTHPHDPFVIPQPVLGPLPRGRDRHAAGARGRGGARCAFATAAPCLRHGFAGRDRGAGARRPARLLWRRLLRR